MISGCATVLRGNKQYVAITTDPPGANFLVLPSSETGTTPAKLWLRRGLPVTVIVEKDEFAREYGYIDRLPDSHDFWWMYAGNVFLGGGLISLMGMGIDSSNKGDLRWELAPRNLHFELRPSTSDPVDDSP
jgi:hypothetical protein